LKSLRQYVVPAVVALAVGVPASAPAQSSTPKACFKFSPAAPQTGQTVTFDSSCSKNFDARGWDLDNDGAFDDGTGVTATKSWPTAGTYTVRLGVIDQDSNYDIQTQTVTVSNSNRAPVAAFSFSPAAPTTGQSITFTSSATDPDGTIAKVEWDFDGNGAYDATGASAATSYATAGARTVVQRVTDNKGAQSTTSKTVTASNRLPVAAFTFSPAAPLATQLVTFTSTSNDPDGTIASQAWDLDNDRAYDDGSGRTATRTFAAPGTYPIALRVTDNLGAVSFATQTVQVAAGARPDPTTPTTPTTPADSGGGFDSSIPVTPAPPSQPPSQPPITTPPVFTPLRTLDPFPIVRIRGRTTPTGAKISLLTVRAPDGAVVTLRCFGKGCPSKPLSAKVKATKGRASATVSFNRVRGTWRAGTVLRVLVAKKGLIGKYTQFTIRKRKAPVRLDSCLMPGSGRPAKCPVAP
jgi:PKD repeat protein